MHVHVVMCWPAWDMHVHALRCWPTQYMHVHAGMRSAHWMFDCKVEEVNGPMNGIQHASLGVERRAKRLCCRRRGIDARARLYDRIGGILRKYNSTAGTAASAKRALKKLDHRP